VPEGLRSSIVELKARIARPAAPGNNRSHAPLTAAHMCRLVPVGRFVGHVCTYCKTLIQTADLPAYGGPRLHQPKSMAYDGSGCAALRSHGGASSTRGRPGTCARLLPPARAVAVHPLWSSASAPLQRGGDEIAGAMLVRCERLPCVPSSRQPVTAARFAAPV
jgi:hypothetical protein